MYDWLVPEPLLTPEGSAAAFDELVAHLSPGARVLDCAAGTGQLAVGLAQRGFEVVASDASGAMVARTAELAQRHGVALEARRCPWDELPEQGWPPFEVVFCVGNSLAHAADRREALEGMRGVLAEGGFLVLTSRN